MRELGIRVALGARSIEVLGLVLRTGALLTGVGLLIGVGAFLATSRVLNALVYGVSAHDSTTILSGVVALALLALLGCVVPATRATRVDPIEVLRSE